MIKLLSVPVDYSGQLKLFKFDPIEFSPLCCNRAICLGLHK